VDARRGEGRAMSFDVIVVGEGIAGLAAARDCARAGLRTGTVEQMMFGGLVTSINELVDWPGEGSEPCSGSDLAANWITEAADAGVESLGGQATGIEAADGGLLLHTDAGTHAARCLIVASGAARRPLGIPGEDAYVDRGLSHCADCDGPLVKGADVVVVGGGDSALQEAAVLAHYARTVHVVHRGTAFRARPAVRAVFEQAFAGREGALSIHWQSTVTAIEGDDGIEAVQVAGPGGTTRLQARAVYPCVGLVPNSAWTGLPVDAAGAIVVDDRLATPMPGVHAIGAVRAGHGGRLVDAVADAALAAGAVKEALQC
jgi:thioredoxin reductase (NADPH)